ncbi:MAG: lysophospholipid acyltransferase family protein, partial [Oscillospiraceae bacterium]
PQCFFMAKEELFKMPFLSAIFRKLGAFPVARGKGDTAAIDRAVQIVKDGHIVAIFPEGTRSTDGKLLRLKSGAILIAAQTGGDLLPCVVKKERGRFLRKRVIIRYGKIIENTALGITGTIPSEIKKANKLLTDTLTHMLEEPSSN